MKLWMRYIAGTVAGIALGVLVPASGGDTLIVLGHLTDILIRLGRFLLFPMAFFAMIIAVDELRDDRRTFAVLWKSLVVTAVTVAGAVAAALVAMLVFQPQRVPPMVQESTVVTPPTVFELLRTAIPRNGFHVFSLGESAFAMILLLALLVGWTLRYDREITSPVSLVADSANRILYRLNQYFTGVLGFLLAIPVGMVVVQLRETPDLALFTQFLIVIGTTVVVVGVVIYPVVLYLFGRDPAAALRWVTGMTAPGLAALSSGDVYFATPTLARAVKEEHGVPRRIGGSATYALAVFNRAGSAMVAVAAFLLVIRSYTALEIGVGETAGIVIAGVLFSFLLGRTPAGGVTLLLSYLAIRYGRGMEESYLILLPIIPVLERLGAWLDVMTHGFVTVLVADMERVRRSTTDGVHTTARG
ncbi:MAG: cation:dicarboxylase symporter family transporter [Spirochaeta sp.]|jgi:Na+/H+-dicarboxylate symporter|nr:cation:dicarboxylase symporter family transporter [Spirochaeta sp.]